MKVKQEIDRFAAEEDKPILFWLLDRYSRSSQWHFVAVCSFKRYGMQSYEVHRVWTPTYEGRILYEAMKGA